ncbi:ABC-type Fe3+-hydroxamate transport system, periplasmic component [Hahella chejuensis KCTC 2396]|uniref:ABC-type Fe3+-hydroxamate transport system, periplasmic component n=1 Tax=Hahella chejuensis (strain KCTC 2396) TaxID=349521 RepID=Q2SGM2_HAHCH|nr:iron-siderophore ABC transporter substrate-binding protein [Hahella chejuensis]ABC30202.1 ABC-type Fe3+-hydroxamate transport system, periplasmic component [Hahella chejuensis KCTC 2396]
MSMLRNFWLYLRSFLASHSSFRALLSSFQASLFRCAAYVLSFSSLLFVGPGSAYADEESVRRIEHSMGVTQVSGTPVRVVTLFQGATDTAIALGVIPVGVVDSWAEKPTYKYLRPHLQGVPHVGLETQPNLEVVAGLKPDLIIASKRRHEKIYGHLTQIAPTIALETVFDFKDTVTMMGLAMNRQAQAETLLRNWNDRVADFQQQIQLKLGDQWPQEVSAINFRADHARLYLQGSYTGSILHELGFVSPPNHPQDHWMQKLATKESIPAMNADVFFVFMNTEDPAVLQGYADWTRHPLWKNLDAVRKHQVFQVDQIAWHLSGSILGANLMLDQIYDHFGLAGPTQ